MRRFVTGGRIDVFENEGKASGAYSAGVYGVRPYLLLNWGDTLDDTFTLAHSTGMPPASPPRRRSAMP
jgi:oligoendopeptidase F